MCVMLRDMLEDAGDASEPINLPIPCKHLEDIIFFCQHYEFDFPEEKKVPHPLPSKNLEDAGID